MFALLAVAALTPQTFAKLEPVPFTKVRIADRFWTPRQETNRKITVDHSLKMLDEAGNFLVMRLAAEGKHEGYKGLLFTDSDLYKTLEGISYTLAAHPNPALDKRVDEIIAMIAAAQQPDGYIDTWFQVTRPQDKFKNLRDWHELYCAGHMFEAAVAHHQATGKTNFLNVAIKYANLIYDKFGPSGKPGYCGHPEIELALVKLWKDTKDARYFELARRMVEHRGEGYFATEHNTPKDEYDGTYWLDDMPIADHKDIKGHAVRAAYLLSGTADVARETEDPKLTAMLRRVWRSATERRVFITGGIGPSASNEGFTVDYDLPNLTAYQETCASIAMSLWGQRMALLFGDASYMDSVERALYNGVLSGIGLDGKGFFYVNPLASMGNHHRQPWFQCACCPPNVLRTIASVGGYAYATSKDSLYVNLFIAGGVDAQVGGRPVSLDVQTDYPWDGKVELRQKSAGSYALRVRNPGWCRGASVKVNGAVIDAKVERGYFVIDRSWRAGDVVTLDLPMPVEQIEAHPGVKEDRGRSAIQRGPLVYCAEQVDNDMPVDELVVPIGAKLEARSHSDVLGGVTLIEGDAARYEPADWERKLYQPSARSQPAKARFVPYCFWDNRKPGRMEVWLPTAPPPARVVGPEGKAEVSLSFRSGNAQPWGINDGVEPASSGEQPKALCHFWPHKGGEEWVQYTWKKSQKITGIDVYWFDDTGRGECRLPESWKLQALIGGAWQDVAFKPEAAQLDKWNKIEFVPVETTALRLVVKQRPGWASGIHEWKVTVSDDES